MVQMENSELESKDWAIWFGLKVAQILRAIGLWSGHAILCDDVQTIVEQEIKTMDEMLHRWQWNLEVASGSIKHLWCINERLKSGSLNSKSSLWRKMCSGSYQQEGQAND